MPQTNNLSVSSLGALLGLDMVDCPCGRPHRVPTLEAPMDPGCLDLLPELAGRYFPSGPVVCVMDANTRHVAGERAAALVSQNGATVYVHQLDADGSAVHADRKTVNKTRAVLETRKAAGVVAVGSGTINDICKSAATFYDCPLITVATAASMNGYPSAISALTDKGIKITEPCRPPVAVICDPDILASAPAKMTGAGFGDLLSKNASTADWHVSHILMGDYFCPFAAELAEAAVSRCLENEEAIRENRPRGIAVLIDALMRSGISMKVAGSSSPASGGEHLISHLWDMTAHWTGRTPALHGAQTGVTTLLSLKLYEKLLALDTNQVRALCEAPFPVEPKDRFEQRIRQTFRDLADGVFRFAAKKHLDEKGAEERRGRILAKWEEIRKAARGVVISAKASKDHLRAAGAVFRASDLGISENELVFAYKNARYIRDRYTVLDLAADLGVLQAWEQEVLDTVRAEPGSAGC